MTLRKTVSCNDVYSLLKLYGFDFHVHRHVAFFWNTVELSKPKVEKQQI